jgi:hypothetical protein
MPKCPARKLLAPETAWDPRAIDRIDQKLASKRGNRKAKQPP